MGLQTWSLVRNGGIVASRQDLKLDAKHRCSRLSGSRPYVSGFEPVVHPLALVVFENDGFSLDWITQRKSELIGSASKVFDARRWKGRKLLMGRALNRCIPRSNNKRWRWIVWTTIGFIRGNNLAHYRIAQPEILGNLRPTLLRR